MANQKTSATQSLTKQPASRGKSDAASSAKRRNKPISQKQRTASDPPPIKQQVARGRSSSTTAGPVTKQGQLAALLLREEGATIAQMKEGTGWLPHTVRAALTGLKKKGYGIDSDKVADVRTYRAIAPQ